MDVITRLFTIIGLYMGMTLVFAGLQAGIIEGVYYLFTKRTLEAGPNGVRFILFVSIIMSLLWICLFAGIF